MAMFLSGIWLKNDDLLDRRLDEKTRTRSRRRRANIRTIYKSVVHRNQPALKVSDQDDQRVDVYQKAQC